MANKQYTLRGLAKLDDEPVFIRENTFMFLCDSLYRPMTQLIADNLEDLDIVSGYCCDPQTGTGYFRRTNPRNRFSCYPDLSVVDATHDCLESGTLYSLFKDEYPDYTKQLENMNSAQNSRSNYPISRLVCLSSFGYVSFAGRRCGTYTVDRGELKVVISSDFDIIELLEVELKSLGIEYTTSTLQEPVPLENMTFRSIETS